MINSTSSGYKVVGGCGEQSGEVVVVVVVTRLMRLPAAQHVTRDTVTAALVSHCSFVTHILEIVM